MKDLFKSVIFLVVVIYALCEADGRMCVKQPTYCGPYIELDACKHCCANQFPMQQHACEQWCFEGIIKN